MVRWKSVYSAKLLLALIGITGMIGCASEPVTYVKPGATPAEFQMTLAKCKMSLQQTQLLMPPVAPAADFGGSLSQLGATLDSNAMQADYFNNCMISNGWFPQRRKAIQPSQPQFSEEIKEALKNCHGSDDRDTAMEWAQCYGEVQRPIWAKYKPADLDLFDAYISNVTMIATQFQNGETDHEEYVTDLQEAGKNWKKKIQARRTTSN